MGILNLTPDSFSDGGRFLDPALALDQARHLVAAGARLLDLGAESTRPGAASITDEIEWQRLDPVLAALGHAHLPTQLSLDTHHPEVARRGLEAGVGILNDVTGFQAPAMLSLAQRTSCGLIAMRSRREGAGFHMPPYDDPTPQGPAAAIAELGAVRDRLLRAGITPERVLLDPGFGFGTTYQEDLALWQALPSLPEALNWPVERFCIGISRKRFLAFRNDTPGLPADQRDALTAAAHGEAQTWGYRVFRTHAVG